MCHLRMTVMHLPNNFAQIALSNSELLTLAEIQDGDRRHLGFSVYVNFSKYTDRINLKQEVKVN